jgi:hypothetical protein
MREAARSSAIASTLVSGTPFLERTTGFEPATPTLARLLGQVF